MSNPSGIQLAITSEGSARIIPATYRADGSMRAERRVKPGYVPPEDIETFKTRRQQNLGSNSAPPGSPQWLKERQNKKEQTEKRDNQKINREKAIDKKEIEKQAHNDKRQNEHELKIEHSISGGIDTNEDGKVALEKTELDSNTRKMRALKKRIRQTQELQTKHQSGIKLDPDQLVKLRKLDQLCEELARLETN